MFLNDRVIGTQITLPILRSPCVCLFKPENVQI